MKRAASVKSEDSSADQNQDSSEVSSHLVILGPHFSSCLIKKGTQKLIFISISFELFLTLCIIIYCRPGIVLIG